MRTSFRPVLAATVFLSLFGYVWYGILFQSLQMQAHGYTASDYAGNSPLWYTGGVLISLVIAMGLQHMLRLNKREFGHPRGSVYKRHWPLEPRW